MGTESRPPSTAFGRLLREFKREGCNLLLVGQTPERVRRTARRRLLGSASERRYRLLVLAGGRATPPFVESDEFDADARRRARSIECDVERRTAAAASPDPSFGSVGPEAAPGSVDDLDSLSTRISAEIASLERIDGGFGPGELRVSVDSLAPLLAATDERRVRSFLEAVTSRVRIARGMGHYFLPVEYGSATERALRDRFDAVLEHRVTNDGAALERWHVPERDLTSRWVEI